MTCELKDQCSTYIVSPKRCDLEYIDCPARRFALQIRQWEIEDKALIKRLEIPFHEYEESSKFESRRR
jgi:hypothetical protein